MSVAFEHHVGPWTVDEVMALPEDRGTRVELVGGVLMMSPAPHMLHQRVSSNLYMALTQAARAADAPVDVYEAVNLVLPDGLLIPDLVLVDAGTEPGVTVDAADVVAVVEIASPSTKVADRKVKPQLYAAAGIAHFWRLELEPAPRLLRGRLEDGAYAELPPLLAGTTGRIEEPFPLELDPAALVRR